jgi:hypothetical protein
MIVFSFNANVCLDYEERKVNLHPTVQRREDYVHNELRRLRESLRSESFKIRRPVQFSCSLLCNYLIISIFFLYSKAHEPFVYNDLRPYFDTSTVEKAIHEVNKYLKNDTICLGFFSL